MGLAKSRFRAKARKMIPCSGTAPRMRIDRGWTCTGFSRTLSAYIAGGMRGNGEYLSKGSRPQVECSWGFDVDRRPEIKSLGPQHLKFGHASSNAVVVASPRLPLSQRSAQALSSSALASHYHSGRLRFCRRQPSPPTITAVGSDFVVFVVK